MTLDPAPGVEADAPDVAFSRVLAKGLTGEEPLPVLAHDGTDPGAAYFAELVADLRTVFDDLGGASILDRDLAAALFYLTHVTAQGYAAAEREGRELRESLVDPDLLRVELAAESILTGVWHALDNED
jgi:hypothetical protein